MRKLIRKTTIIADALLEDERVADIILKYGMECATCPYRWEETMEVGAGCHNADIIEILAEINNLK
ncbi:hypothetical protein J6O86_07560 [bacterium]|nr:hypothetical protein [bacterium]